MDTAPEVTIADDVLRGITAIAGFIGETERRAFYLCERRYIPVGKQGAHWIASKRALRAHYNQLTSGEAA